MQINEWKQLRELAAFTQWQTATKSGVSRMKLSLAECGQVELTGQEKTAVRNVLEKAIRERSALIREVLPDTRGHGISA